VQSAMGLLAGFGATCIVCTNERMVQTMFKKFFTKKDWRRVATIEVPIVETNPLQNEPKKGTLYYYLYENQFGDRKYDVADTFRGDYDIDDVEERDVTFRCEEYLKTVKPWLEGDYDPEITDYEGVKRRDMLGALKGKKA